MNRRGITLIELLVAMIVAGIVGYLAFNLVLSENTNYTHTRTNIRLQSDGREAVRVMEEDLLNVGYRAGLKYGGTTNRYPASLNTCDTLGSQDRVAIRDGGTGGPDTITFRFYGEDPVQGVQCEGSPNVVSYYVRSDSTLARDLTPQVAGGTTPTTTTSIILKGAITLQARLGVDTTSDSIQSGRVNDTLWMKGEQGFWTPTSVSAPVWDGANSRLSIQGWSVGTEGKIASNLTKTLQPNSTYRLSALLQVNAAFQTMFDTTNYSTNYIRFQVKGTGDTDSTSIKLPPTSNPTWVTWQFQTGSGSVANTQLILKGRLTLAGSGPSLYLSHLKVLRVRNAGEGGGQSPYTWQDESTVSATALAQQRQTVALHIWLLTRSVNANKQMSQTTFSGLGNWTTFTPTDHNSYALYDRVIPVGNYGY
jgi:prepilin-type N-terminal cleavage/methylation domain-containing protein